MLDIAGAPIIFLIFSLPNTAIPSAKSVIFVIGAEICFSANSLKILRSNCVNQFSIDGNKKIIKWHFEYDPSEIFQAL